MTTDEYRDEGFRLYDENIEKAVECFKKAAEDNDITSAIALAGYYYDEEGEDEIAKDWLEKAFKCYEDAATISKDTSFNTKLSFNIIEVTPDSVTFEVKSDFAPDYKTFNDTIRRGETKKYENSHEATATIYDEDYDYTIESRLAIKAF